MVTLHPKLDGAGEARPKTARQIAVQRRCYWKLEVLIRLTLSAPCLALRIRLCGVFPKDVLLLGVVITHAYNTPSEI